MHGRSRSCHARASFHQRACSTGQRLAHRCGCLTRVRRLCDFSVGVETREAPLQRPCGLPSVGASQQRAPSCFRRAWTRTATQADFTALEEGSRRPQMLLARSATQRGSRGFHRTRRAQRPRRGRHLQALLHVAVDCSPPSTRQCRRRFGSREHSGCPHARPRLCRAARCQADATPPSQHGRHQRSRSQPGVCTAGAAAQKVQKPASPSAAHASSLAPPPAAATVGGGGGGGGGGGTPKVAGIRPRRTHDRQAPCSI